ncbi:MAG: leucine-rich repeat domain-containing protein [Clostridia bacterium]|nr:leucine-rich repeat domain-containing protein [Clostridia bacterium]
MKNRIIALIVCAAAVCFALPAVSACSSEAYVTYTLYDSDGNTAGTYKLAEDPSEGEMQEVEAGDGYYFEVTGCSGNPVNVVIPSEYGGVPVTGIGAQAFENARHLSSVTMADSVTSIGVAAFLYCVRLTDVQLSASLTEIPQSAFAYCTLLKEIVIPEGVTSIGYWAFYTCEALQSVTLPDSLVSIANYAFNECYVLEDIVMPSNLQTIGDSAFLNCYKIASLTMPDTLESIGYAAFQNCTSLAEVNLGSGLKYIEKYAFCYCLLLEEVTIPADVEYIGENAFCACTSLANVYMSDYFSDGSLKACYLYETDLSSLDTPLEPNTSEASDYLYTDYNYYENDTAGQYAGYIPSGSFSDSEKMADLLVNVLAGNTNLEYSSDVSVYWYFVKL